MSKEIGRRLFVIELASRSKMLRAQKAIRKKWGDMTGKYHSKHLKPQWDYKERSRHARMATSQNKAVARRKGEREIVEKYGKDIPPNAKFGISNEDFRQIQMRNPRFKRPKGMTAKQAEAEKDAIFRKRGKTPSGEKRDMEKMATHDAHAARGALQTGKFKRNPRYKAQKKAYKEAKALGKPHPLKPSKYVNKTGPHYGKHPKEGSAEYVPAKVKKKPRLIKSKTLNRNNE